MMNELDKLKSAWKTISEAETKKEYSADDLRKIVSKRSNNELAKIRRKIISEWTIALVLSALLVLYIHLIKPADTKYALVFIGIILAISFFPYINVIRLKFTTHTHLKNYLSEFILRFDKLVQQYIRMAALLIPVAGLGGFLLGLHSAADQHEWEAYFSLVNILLILAFLVFISLGGHWVQRRYFKWIYGKNMQRLRNCLHELEEVEDVE